MNKTLSLILWAPISLVIGFTLSQLTSAAVVRDPNVVEKACGAGGDTIYEIEDENPDDSGDESGDESAEISTWLDDFYSNLEDSYEAEHCGAENIYTDALEKGDCTAAGKIITEIAEPVGPAVTLGDDKVINVYTGICCLAAYQGADESDSYCSETRTVYYYTYDDCEDSAAYCERRQWLISSTGAGLIKTYAKQMYIFGAGIGGFIAVVIIVASGIQISVSGVTGDITSAKDRIIQAITGLVLLFLSGLILYTINPTFFG